MLYYMLYLPCLFMNVYYLFSEYTVVTNKYLCYFVCFVKQSETLRCEYFLIPLFLSTLSDQYAFCRYMIDMFVHGDLKPGIQKKFLYSPV